MEIKVPFAQITDKKQGYEAAKKLIPETIAKFNVKADIKHDDGAHSMVAKGSGFEAKIQFTDTEAIVNVELGMLLKPFKGKILEVLEKQIKKVV